MAHDNNRVRVRVVSDGNAGLTTLKIDTGHNLMVDKDTIPTITTGSTRDGNRDTMLYATDSSGNPVQLVVYNNKLLIQDT